MNTIYKKIPGPIERYLSDDYLCIIKLRCFKYPFSILLRQLLPHSSALLHVVWCHFIVWSEGEGHLPDVISEMVYWSIHWIRVSCDWIRIWSWWILFGYEFGSDFFKIICICPWRCPTMLVVCCFHTIVFRCVPFVDHFVCWHPSFAFWWFTDLFCTGQWCMTSFIWSTLSFQWHW